MSAVSIQITVNGSPQPLPPDGSVEGLIDQMKIKHKGFAVEVNGQLVSRDAFKETLLKNGDQVEVVTFVGGG